MDQSPKKRGLGALHDVFQAMMVKSRAEPSPSLDVRLDRLARLRAAISENEARFEQAISVDFGERSATETLRRCFCWATLGTQPGT